MVHFQDPKVWCCLGSFLLSSIWLANPNPDRECGSRMVGHSRGSRHFPQRGLYSTKEEECSTEASLSDLLRPSPLLCPVHSAIPTANTNQLQRHILTTIPQSPLSRQPCYPIYRTRSKVRRATPRRTHFTLTTTLRSPSNYLAPLSGLAPLLCISHIRKSPNCATALVIAHPGNAPGIISQDRVYKCASTRQFRPRRGGRRNAGGK